MAGTRWLSRGVLARGGAVAKKWLDFAGAPKTSVAKILAAVLFAGVAPQMSLAQTMSLPGSFSVGTAGTATYNIPISVPPGAAGLTPSLSLEYSSQAGNGLLGVGWSLSGLLSIGHCPQTATQDGVRGAVNYDSNDRFCLDGQRLVAISGTYGADGTEYRTEVESFSRVISHGTAGNGPAWFEVHTKAGQIMEFGHTPDSQVLALGKSTPRNWALNKLSDTKGNYFTVTYTNDTTNGQAYPIEIDYTGNAAANVSPTNKVVFAYTTRPDITPQYQAGSLSRTTVLLTDVQTYAQSALVADYKLTYGQSNDTGRSRLSGVTVCINAGANCLPVTNFSWSDDSPGMFTAGSTASSPVWVPFPGDFNGDGNADVLWCNLSTTAPIACGAHIIWLSNGDGTFTAGSSQTSAAGDFPWLADFNGDGKTDIFWCGAPGSRLSGAVAAGACVGSATVWLSNGDGTFTTQSAIQITFDLNPSLGDFNGDGRTDILWCSAPPFNGSSSPSNNCSTVVLWLSNGDGTFTTVSEPSVPGYRPRFGDFNGDGKTDILWCNVTSTGASFNTNGCSAVSVWFSNGDGTFAGVSSPAIPGTGWIPLLGDLNGDGKADILWCDGPLGTSVTCSNVIVWLSNGNGTFTVASSLSSPSAGWSPLLADLNGDGRTDVLWCAGSAGCSAVVPWLSKGDGTFTVTSTLSAPGWGPSIGDFNGDGRADVLWCEPPLAGSGANPNSCSAVLPWLSTGSSQGAASSDLLTSVATGIGATTSISYQPLTKPSVYSKDANATYPLVDVSGSIYVVSRVDASNGVGGNYSSTYSYAGAKLDLSGRGFLGVRQAAATDLQTNIVQTTAYRQDFPFIGSVASTSKTLNTSVLNQTTNTYQFSNAGGAASLSAPAVSSAPYRVSVAQIVSTSTDLDGSVIPSTTTNYQYDTFNNATQVAVSTSDGYSKTTNNTYTNDTTNWFLGRLTAATVTAQAPQQLGQYCPLPFAGGGTINSGQSVTAYSAVHPPAGQTCASIAQTRTCDNGTLTGSYTFPGCVVLQPKTIILTSGSSWTVPADWNNTFNTVAVIGAGGGGLNGTAGVAGATGSTISPFNGGNGGAGGAGGAGGGGGAYSLKNNVVLAANATIAINVGTSGVGISGGDTYFNGTSCSAASACAKGGAAGGTGGSATSGVGDTKFSGGIAAGGTAGAAGAPGLGGVNGSRTWGGAGGAGGASGAGGAGGGAGGPHGAGANASGTSGGTGDAGNTAAAANGTQYTSSIGAGGGANAPGGVAGGAGGFGRGNDPTGVVVDDPGSPGGAGSSGGHAGSYGAGGAGGSGGSGGGGGAGEGKAGGAGGAGGAGSAGSGGLIVITYTPAS